MALLRNVTTGVIIATRVERAETWLERAVGLLGRPGIRPEEGLWIASCSAIHTIGMRKAIDLIFVDEQDRVVRLAADVAAWRAIVSFKARAVIELGAGALREVDIMQGDRLELVSAANLDAEHRGGIEHREHREHRRTDRRGHDSVFGTERCHLRSIP